MNSRCLYCDKRLSLFHGKKKPFCCDAHEDLHLERQALSGLDRLRDDYLETGHPARTLTAAATPPKPPGQFAYPELEPGFFDDDPVPAGIFNRPPQRLADGVPPPADYLISSACAVQAAPPSLPLRDLAEVAFHALAWTRPVLFEGAPWFVAPSQPTAPPEPVPPPMVTSLEPLPMPLVTQANLPVHLDSSKISALPDEPHYSIPVLESQPQAIEPEAPPLITSLVSPPIAPFRAGASDAPRRFRDSPLDMALPVPVYQPHCHALKFVAAPPAAAPRADVSPQRGRIEHLPAPEPLRFRTLLDLRVAAFHTSTHHLFPAPLPPLTWNAAPPEALNWPLVLQRRRPGPILPKLERVLLPQERHL